MVGADALGRQFQRRALVGRHRVRRRRRSRRRGRRRVSGVSVSRSNRAVSSITRRIAARPHIGDDRGDGVVDIGLSSRLAAAARRTRASKPRPPSRGTGPCRPLLTPARITPAPASLRANRARASVRMARRLARRRDDRGASRRSAVTSSASTSSAIAPSPASVSSTSPGAVLARLEGDATAATGPDRCRCGRCPGWPPPARRSTSSTVCTRSGGRRGVAAAASSQRKRLSSRAKRAPLAVPAHFGDRQDRVLHQRRDHLQILGVRAPAGAAAARRRPRIVRLRSSPCTRSIFAPTRAPASPRHARSRGRDDRPGSPPSRPRPPARPGSARPRRADRSPSPARPSAARPRSPWRCRRARRSRAPMRISSGACMKRFSKIVSSSTLVPSAVHSSAIICACRSVGKPGKGSVATSTARDRGRCGARRSARARSRCTAMPAASQLVAEGLAAGRSGRRGRSTSPPEIAGASM